MYPSLLGTAVRRSAGRGLAMKQKVLLMRLQSRGRNEARGKVDSKMIDACFSLPRFVVVRLVARCSSLIIVIVIVGRFLDPISDVGSVPIRGGRRCGGDYSMRASIASEKAMANAMVATADDRGRIVGSRMAMRAKV